MSTPEITTTFKTEVENWLLDHVGDEEYSDREACPDLALLCEGASKEFGIPSDTDWLTDLAEEIIENLEDDADEEEDEDEDDESEEEEEEDDEDDED